MSSSYRAMHALEWVRCPSEVETDVADIVPEEVCKEVVRCGVTCILWQARRQVAGRVHRAIVSYPARCVKSVK